MRPIRVIATSHYTMSEQLKKVGAVLRMQLSSANTSGYATNGPHCFQNATMPATHAEQMLTTPLCYRYMD
jgi:hypothetical protein